MIFIVEESTNLPDGFFVVGEGCPRPPFSLRLLCVFGQSCCFATADARSLQIVLREQIAAPRGFRFLCRRAGARLPPFRCGNCSFFRVALLLCNSGHTVPTNCVARTHRRAASFFLLLVGAFCERPRETAGLPYGIVYTCFYREIFVFSLGSLREGAPVGDGWRSLRAE